MECQKRSHGTTIVVPRNLYDKCISIQQCSHSEISYPANACSKVFVDDIANSQGTQIRSSSIVIRPRNSEGWFISSEEVSFGEIVVATKVRPLIRVVYQ